MADRVSEDLNELVMLLNEVGLPGLAGDLLVEVAEGREASEVPTATGEGNGAGAPASEAAKPATLDGRVRQVLGEGDLVRLDNGAVHVRRYRESGPAPVADTRYPIPPDEQMGFAADFLERRILRPAIRLAEAERLAGELAANPDPPPHTGGAAPEDPAWTSARSASAPDGAERRPDEEGGRPPLVRLDFDKTVVPTDWVTLRRLKDLIGELRELG